MIPSAMSNGLEHPACAMDGRRQPCDLLSNRRGGIKTMGHKQYFPQDYGTQKVFSPGTTVELGSSQWQVMQSIVMDLELFLLSVEGYGGCMSSSPPVTQADPSRGRKWSDLQYVIRQSQRQPLWEVAEVVAREYGSPKWGSSEGWWTSDIRRHFF